MEAPAAQRDTLRAVRFRRPEMPRVHHQLELSEAEISKTRQAVIDGIRDRVGIGVAARRVADLNYLSLLHGWRPSRAR